MANEMLNRLTGDMKAAMKAGDKDRVQVLRMLISGLKEEQHRKETDDLDEAAEMAVIRRAVKTRRETIEQAKETGRDEIAASEAAEIAVIEDYLPTMMTGDALLTKVREVAEEVGFAGPADTGKFMKVWMSKYQGQAEGRDVQAALKQL